MKAVISYFYLKSSCSMTFFGVKKFYFIDFSRSLTLCDKAKALLSAFLKSFLPKTS